LLREAYQCQQLAYQYAISGKYQHQQPFGMLLSGMQENPFFPKLTFSSHLTVQFQDFIGAEKSKDAISERFRTNENRDTKNHFLLVLHPGTQGVEYIDQTLS